MVGTGVIKIDLECLKSLTDHASARISVRGGEVRIEIKCRLTSQSRIRGSLSSLPANAVRAGIGVSA